MTGFDFVLLAILAASGILGLIRGLLKEILSLIAYVAAFAAAIWWGPTVHEWLTMIDTSLLRMAVAYGAVFIVVLLGVGLLNMTLAVLVRTTGLGPADHGLGGLFGVLRGALIVLVLVAVAGYTPMPQESWWTEAMFSGTAVNALQHVKTWLPPDLADWLPYSSNVLQ